MTRDSPKRRAAKREQLVENLQEVVDQMNHITPIEVSVRVLAEALIFLLEAQCPKKH